MKSAPSWPRRTLIATNGSDPRGIPGRVTKPAAPNRGALRKIQLTVRDEGAGKRLDQFLADSLPGPLGQPLSKAKVRQLVVAGAVYLNGKRVRIASKTVFNGARVEAYVDLKKLFESHPSRVDIPFTMGPDSILFEDDDLIAVNKPAGLPTQPTVDEARANLFAVVKRYLSERDRNPGAYVGLHHRLDRDTSGVILFTKRLSANAGVARLFAEHLAEKTYLALARKPSRLPPPAWKVDNFLAGEKGGGRARRNRYQSVRSGGDRAITDFRLVEELPSALLIEAKPRTGRTHQIRVHLSEGGMPILGDTTYGGEDPAVPRLLLHAAALTFPHPAHNNTVTVQAPIPKDFAECLQALKGKPSPRAR